MRFVLLVSFLSILFFKSFTQSGSGLTYPKGYFRYPLDVAPRLNANFGEMRPNHFHMGLDLFTLRKENLPVYAAAEGYVARVKIEPGGFGRAVSLNHPNGLTTLYAHMNDFMPQLEAYTKQKQYELEKWEVELQIPRELFPVRRGQVIGYSGNTGASLGPHVHFEIRETESEKCVNPLLFGFDIPDNVPPKLVRLALYDRNLSMYDQSPLLIPLKKVGGAYTATGIIKINTDKVSLAIQGTDQMSGVPNANGIFSANLYDGNEHLGGFQMKRIGYDETRYLNSHIDYNIKATRGFYLQNIFPMPGDRLEIYQEMTGRNFINLLDTAVHIIRIDIGDQNGNFSQASFALQKTYKANAPVKAAGYKMKPGEINVYETENLQAFFPETCFYDSLNFAYSADPNVSALAFSPVHHLHHSLVPVQSYFTVRIKPDKTIPYHLRDRLLVKTINSYGTEVKKATWELGWYSARFRDFGLFQLVADTQPPQILAWALKNGANLARASKIVISVKDNYEIIKSFRAELDGKWLMFSEKGNVYTYKFDEHCPKGQHELKIKAEDEAGNVSEKVFRFVR